MKKDYLFLFHTPLGAVLLKKALAVRQIPYKIIDAPRALTAECSLAAKFTLAETEDFSLFINEQVSSVYLCHNDKPHLLWQDES